MLATLARRLPNRNESLPVLGTLVFVIYGFALFRFYWYVPSWLGYLSLGEVLAVGAYAMVYALVESLGMLALLLALAALLPARWLRSSFATKASLVIWILSAWAIYIHDKINSLYVPLDGREFAVAMFWAALFVLSSLALGWYLVLHRFDILQRGFASFTERLTVFLYLYLPLAGLSFVVVLLRSFGIFVR
jgi:hypothetical protein